MAMITRNVKFQFSQGKESDLPILSLGEPALTTDTNKFFIGTSLGNEEVSIKKDTAIDLILENGKLYLIKLDGSKIGEGVILPISTSGNVDLDDYALKSELHSHDNKSVIDTITSRDINNWNSKSVFSGSYSDLVNKPMIPTRVSDLTNDSGYLTQHQSLEGLATEQFVTDKIAEASLGGDDSSIDLSGLVTKNELENANYLTQNDIDTLKPQLKGDKGDIGEKGERGEDGLTTAISVNGQTYNHVNGTIVLPNYPTVPINISSFNNDSGYLTEHQSLDDYAKLVDVPTRTSDLENDSNFATESFVTSKIADASLEGGNVDLSGYATKDDLGNKVDKVEGKSLILDSEITRLANVTNYNDTDIKNRLDSLENIDHNQYLTQESLNGLASTEYVDKYKVTYKNPITLTYSEWNSICFTNLNKDVTYLSMSVDYFNTLWNDLKALALLKNEYHMVNFYNKNYPLDPQTFTMGERLSAYGKNIMKYIRINTIDIGAYNSYSTFTKDSWYIGVTDDNKVVGILSRLYNQHLIGDSLLSKTNTTQYTPTSDYHPATKKYVDDAIDSIEIPDGNNIDLSAYQTKTDETLTTENKNIVEAINELKTQSDNIVNDKLGGYSYKPITQAEYDELTDEEKNDNNIIYIIKDRESASGGSGLGLKILSSEDASI